MTKADIAERIANANGFTKLESMDLVESVLAIIKDTLADGETLKISGFGNFVVKEKTDRRGRNPQTGEDITIDARRVLTFKPSAMLKGAMNGSRAAD
jgi:integration host factor subunit alpha